MGRVKPSSDHPSLAHRLLQPAALGTLCGMLSAVGYTAANVCLRGVATSQDPFWVSCLKPVPTILLAAPIVLWQAWRKRRCWMSHRAMIALTIAGLFGQLAGNVAFQWSLGVIGMALAVPITLGTLMMSGALLGRVFLTEPVTVRSAVALLILTGSIVVLSSGSGAAHDSVHANGPPEANPATLMLAVGAAALAGFAYAILGVVIRRAVTGSATLAGTLLLVGVCGLVSLFPFSYARLGIQGMLDTGWGDLSIMLLAGVFNAIAFFALSLGLRLISVVHFNLLNASQTAMAALAGLFFFQEALSAPLVVGIVMTVGGLLLIDQRPRSPVVADDSLLSPRKGTPASMITPPSVIEASDETRSGSMACHGSVAADWRDRSP